MLSSSLFWLPFLLIVSLCCFSTSTFVAAQGSAGLGREPMRLSTTGPQNLLPSFFFMAGAEEGGSYTPPPGGYQGGLGKPNPFNPPDTCPDPIFDGTMEDLRVPVLPYLEQDQWGCERVPTNVSVVVLENDYLRAAITPQWGGKIWSLYHKKFNKQLFFNNPAHQPANIGYRKAWTSGGCEWNWAPGYIGHSVFTESDVYTARLDTKRGDVVRVWEYDRLNHTVWQVTHACLYVASERLSLQVDMLLVDDMLFTHATITNPTTEDLRGYWWTCVAMRVTDRTRVVTPANQSITPCVSWPYGAWTLTNTSFRGPDLHGCNAGGGPDGHCAWQQDQSYIGNIPHAHDFFFYNWRASKKFPLPYVTWVDDQGFAVIHSHGKRTNPSFMNGTKFFTWGSNENGRFQCDFLSASNYEDPACQQAPGTYDNFYDPWCKAYKHEGRYTELQIGPAHSQMHTFPVPKNSTVQWTEWFRAWKGNATRMHHQDYFGADGPVAEVEGWLANGGMNFSFFAELDQFFEELSSVRPAPQDVLHLGTPWGALEELVRGKPLAAGAPFLGVYNESNLRANRATAPWVELVKDGGFSAETLALTPTSFHVAPQWISRLEFAAAHGHDNWLVSLHLGTAYLEQGQKNKSLDMFTKSLKQQPSVHAARNLALLGSTHAQQLSYYQQAWALWMGLNASADPDVVPLLGTNIAGEISIWMAVEGEWDALRQLLGEVKAHCEACTSNDRILDAMSALSVHDGDYLTALQIVSSHCFPTYGSDRKRLIATWYQAHLQMEEAELKRPLKRMDIVKLRRRIGCDGDSHTANYLDACIRGPPNIGYAY